MSDLILGASIEDAIQRGGAVGAIELVSAIETIANGNKPDPMIAIQQQLEWLTAQQVLHSAEIAELFTIVGNLQVALGQITDDTAGVESLPVLEFRAGPEIHTSLTVDKTYTKDGAQVSGTVYCYPPVNLQLFPIKIQTRESDTDNWNSIANKPSDEEKLGLVWTQPFPDSLCGIMSQHGPKGLAEVKAWVDVPFYHNYGNNYQINLYPIREDGTIYSASDVFANLSIFPVCEVLPNLQNSVTITIAIGIDQSAIENFPFKWTDDEILVIESHIISIITKMFSDGAVGYLMFTSAEVDQFSGETGAIVKSVSATSFFKTVAKSLNSVTKRAEKILRVIVDPDLTILDAGAYAMAEMVELAGKTGILPEGAAKSTEDIIRKAADIIPVVVEAATLLA